MVFQQCWSSCPLAALPAQTFTQSIFGMLFLFSAEEERMWAGYSLTVLSAIALFIALVKHTHTHMRTNTLSLSLSLSLAINTLTLRPSVSLLLPVLLVMRLARPPQWEVWRVCVCVQGSSSEGFQCGVSQLSARETP